MLWLDNLSWWIALNIKIPMNLSHRCHGDKAWYGTNYGRSCKINILTQVLLTSPSFPGHKPVGDILPEKYYFISRKSKCVFCSFLMLLSVQMLLARLCWLVLRLPVLSATPKLAAKSRAYVQRNTHSIHGYTVFESPKCVFNENALASLTFNGRWDHIMKSRYFLLAVIVFGCSYAHVTQVSCPVFPERSLFSTYRMSISVVRGHTQMWFQSKSSCRDLGCNGAPSGLSFLKSIHHSVFVHKLDQKDSSRAGGSEAILLSGALT